MSQDAVLGPGIPAPDGSGTPEASNAERCDASPRFEGASRLITPCMKPGCGAFGVYGFGANLRRYSRAVEKGEKRAARWLGLWYCAAHKNEGRRPGSTAEVDPDQHVRTRKQGSLF